MTSKAKSSALLRIRRRYLSKLAETGTEGSRELQMFAANWLECCHYVTLP
jgi:hypothetical protein